ncbi:uncharacterized protein RCC_07000 [Ramularia collo-cygni]|uniref:Phosphoglycerate mutase family protein n=1 Tax=Ramularia collo-cygni TaxID=112498 RepID=A0A2D3VGV6_9PEZI|nr:uncharacterized protein RCC_07000 [Ramularia collo-cygni]CZT21139.1 uncharacterized protein RCC_07000 [Ramularia collo-cygni]
MAPAAQTQAPAVVIIARHGMRLDAADQRWHLSTPTPYDPPLTYGGWNQCQALGVRIASLLHAREQKAEEEDHENGNGGRRRRKKHKVVIHSSPFLRCLQTSVAISSGMAQFEEPKDGPTAARARTPAQLHSASPRLRGMDSLSASAHGMASIAEPRHDLQHDLARRALGHHKRYRKSKIRVDAFLGEWLNPQYFDHITPPPPSPMMVAGAKAELMQNQNVDIFTPSVSHKSSSGSLWSGGGNRSAGSSRESPLDDWSHVTNALHAPVPSRDRSNSASSVGSNDSSGRPPYRPKSPYRHGHALQPFTSTIPKPEVAIYRPPRPSYAISNSDYIPRGYFAHARTATANVDYHWDSSRHPQGWGDGGEFGEEWSSMHRRFRRGLNNVVEWYSHHNADDRGEDALGIEQAENHSHVDEQEDQEELVVILVTHGAGCNALIGALTNQPVLLDVGMASLTMAVRKDNPPPLTLPSTPDTESPLNTRIASPDPYSMMNDGQRRSSLDIGLSAIYDLKLVSSSEHLRKGADPTKGPSTSIPPNMKTAHDALPKYKLNGANAHAAAGAGIDSNWDLGETKRGTGNSSLGSMRRPGVPVVPARTASPSYIAKNDDRFASPPPAFTTGLWTPPTARGTPQLSAQVKEDKEINLPELNDVEGRASQSQDAYSPPDSRPTSAASIGRQSSPSLNSKVESDTSISNDFGVEEAADDVGDLPNVSEKLPQSLSRGLSQKGLWGKQISGDKVARKYPVNAPKRRWTMNQRD